MKKISIFHSQLSTSKGFTTFSSHERGFTLVELLLYTVSVSLVLLIGSLTLSLVMSSRTKNQTIAEVESQGAFVMNLITQTVRNATAITIPAVGASGPLLRVSVPAGPKDPTDFDLSTGIIRIIEDSDGVALTAPLTSLRVTASGLNFTNMSQAGTDGTIKMQFTLTYVNPEGRNEFDYAKTFYGSATIR